MTKSTIKVAALSAAIVTALAGCNSSSSSKKNSDEVEFPTVRPPISECRTYEPTPSVIVKGDNENLNRQTITIGATGDMHGRIFAYDYALDDVDVNTGFTKIASLMQEERAANDNFLMIDLGDTVQGNSAELFNDLPLHPVVETMNYLEFDVWVPGNHEFDFERDFLFRSLEGFDGAVISSNIVWAKDAETCRNSEDIREETPFLRGYQVFDYNGAKVAVIGLTPSNVPVWNASNPGNFKSLDFKEELSSLEKVVDQVITDYKPDVVIGALHHGRNEAHAEHGVNEIASRMADRFDVIFMGHEHAQFIEQIGFGDNVEEGMNDISLGGNNQAEDKDAAGIYNAQNRHKKVKVIEPGNWGWALAKADIELEKDQNDQWQIVDTTLSNRTVSDVEEDAGVQNEMRWVHDASIHDANTEIGVVEGNFTNSEGGFADEAVLEERVYDGEALRLYSTIHNAKLADMPLTNLINQIQIQNVEKYGRDEDDNEISVDVSAAALFSDGSNLFDGQTYLKKDSANLYMYDNRVVAAYITGANLKEYIEWSYSYFNKHKDGDITVSFNPDVASFYYDIFGGKIQFSVDLSREVNNRINNIMIDGEDLVDTKKYVLAVNDYRLGDPLLKNNWVEEKDVIWDSANETVYAIRDMLTQYVEDNGLNREDFASNNWYIEQYGPHDKDGDVSIKGDILNLREGEGADLWQKLQSKQICVVRYDSRNNSISVSVNVDDTSTWFKNPNYSAGASEQALYEGCSYSNQPKSE